MTRGRDRFLPAAFAVAAFALALVQRPGWSSSDTKIDLHIDPLRFLGEIASLWTPSSGLGGVEAAQYAGYLFPMGPFFALGHLLGIPDWLVDRLWLGLLLAIGCWGVVRLSERLGAMRSPAAPASAAAVYLLNPYVVVFANRTTVTLLAYALLPWLLLVAWRGLREPRRWRMPALFALLVTACGGGINAAVVAFVLLAPLALVLYEPLTRVLAWRDARAFAWRALVATAAASLWWAAPAAAQGVYGVDFLRFTEPAGAIWATTGMSESFRAMGYWISYIGVGFDGVVRPYFSDSGTLLFNAAVLVATFVLPGAALAGFAWTRTRRYAAFFVALVLLATLLMTVGFPDGTPLRRGTTFAYNHFASVRFLRTTYKAGPLLVLGVAGLAGMAIDVLAVRPRRALVALVAVVAVAAVSAWPLVSGRAVDHQVTWKRIPAAWTAVAHDLDRTLGDDERTVVLPGQLYAFYRWGGTVDPILPALTSKPVAVRGAVPYGDPRGTDLLWTTDALVQQQRLLPGQLAPLLRLMSAGRVVSATDDDVFRSGAVAPAAAARELMAQRLGPSRRYGPPLIRTYRIARPQPLVRVEPPAPLSVVDGSAAGLADLAALGAPPRPPFAYAGDVGSGAVAAAARAGGAIVVSDSNRRRVQVVSRMSQNTGATLAAGDPISQDSATLDPFASRGSAGQTVALLHGARWIRAPFSPGYSQFPENRAFAAFDGDPRTAWLADRALSPDRHWVEVAFMHPRDVPHIDVLPRQEGGAVAAAVEIAGRRHSLRRGWTHVELGLRRVTSLRILVVTAKHGSAAAAGLAEVRVPGLHVSESLRPPVLAEDALHGADIAHAALLYSFSRASGDDPLRHTSSAGVQIHERVTDPNVLEQLRVDGAGDEEAAIDRVIAPPAAREYRARAWVSAQPEAPDSALDRLVGYRGPMVATSAARYQGVPGRRASAALDGDPATAWVTPWDPAARPWLRVVGPRPMQVRTLALTPPPRPARVPTALTLAWDGGRAGPLPVTDGRLVLPRTVRTRTLTLTIDRVVPSLEGSDPLTTGHATTGFAELRVPGLAPMRVPRSGPLRAGCGARAPAIATAGGRLQLRVTADVADLDAGRPLRAVGCAPLRLRAGSQRLRAQAGALRVDQLLLSSPAPAPIARAAATAGAVVDSGHPGRGSRSGVRLALRAPVWLILGESYDHGWRATCDGHSLGAPVPLDGYANAWRVRPSCHKVDFAFAPQTPVRILQLLSALACLVLIAIAIRRPRAAAPASRAAAADAPAASPLTAPAPHMPARRAAIAGIAAGVVLGFCFAIRAGVVIAPAVAFVLWRGIPASLLALAGGLLLAVVVPLVYIVFPAKDMGGYNPGYAGDHIGGHWVAVAAWVLLALAVWRTFSTASRDAGRAPRSGP